MSFCAFEFNTQAHNATETRDKHWFQGPTGLIVHLLQHNFASVVI